MHIQTGMKKNQVLKKFVLGAHPIIEHFIKKLRVTEIIGTYVGSDQRRKVDTEQVLCLLVHNFLTSPKPLYELHDWLKPLDKKSLGLNAEDEELIYDERVARALDDFYDSKHKEVFFHLSLRAIKLFELDCSQIHNDTTTITFSGNYADWDAQTKLAYGHNKDHRPDLKQLVLGVTVTADGAVPLAHEIYDGNQSDDQTHLAMHKRLQKLLGRTDFIYVADSKLATANNLSKIEQWGGRFVSVMPRTWKEDSQFRRQVIQDAIEWDQILSRPNNRQPKSKTDRYDLARGHYVTQQGYTLYWIKSTQKAEQDLQTRMRHIENALDELRLLQTKINKYHLKTAKDIAAKIKSILKEHQCEALLNTEINAHQVCEARYKKIGRPSLTTPRQSVYSTCFTISFSEDQASIIEQSKTDGIFPLITNLDPKIYLPKKVLEIYKFQPFLEKRHAQLKTYQQVAPLYLKTATRVIAVLHIQVMALMIASLIERTLRLAMKQHGIASLPIYPEMRECKAPTLFDIVRLFRDVERYEVNQSDILAIYPAKLDKTHKEVLKLLDVPLSDYH